MLNVSLFSSKTDEWATPQWLYDELDAEFKFTLDVCVAPENAKHKNYFTKGQDGLSQEWTGVCFMNPPYGRDIKSLPVFKGALLGFMNPPYGRDIKYWVKKAYESAEQEAAVVCLLPARTDTSWWHDYCLKAAEIRFLRGWLKFGDSKNSAPFPSAVVVFRRGKTNDLA